MRNHSNEPEVQNFLILAKGSEERRLAIKDLRLKGEIKYSKEDDERNMKERQIIKLKLFYKKIIKLSYN